MLWLSIYKCCTIDIRFIFYYYCWSLISIWSIFRIISRLLLSPFSSLFMDGLTDDEFNYIMLTNSIPFNVIIIFINTFFVHCRRLINIDSIFIIIDHYINRFNSINFNVYWSLLRMSTRIILDLSLTNTSEVLTIFWIYSCSLLCYHYF
jgi:hypothetical protein